VVGAGAGGLGLLAGCGRLPWQAPPEQAPRIGALWFNSPDVFRPFLEAFRQGLREFGYVEGQNVRIDVRWADGHTERFPELVTELLALPVNVLITGSAAATRAAEQATTNIPIVVASSADPVGAGLVASLARPGGNVTGLSNISSQLGAKRLELLKTAVPAIARVAALVNTAGQDVTREFQEMVSAAQVLRVHLRQLEVQGPDDLDAALAAAAKESVDALIVLPGPGALFGARRTQIVEFAAERRVPALYSGREFVDEGGLMAYGPSVTGSFRRAAYYVDRILKGAKPADLPVEQPMTFEFVVNMKTARELGITFPNEIMLQVTEAIQ
jgi:putative ABC transport system substrate-binding protein